MSEHCCHDDCECRIPADDVVLDTRAVVRLAYERGVSEFTHAQTTRRWRWPVLRWFGLGHTKLVDHISVGTAFHWAASGYDPVYRHEIVIVTDGIDVRRLLQVVLHEIEHCIQAESFESLAAWMKDYANNEDTYERRAEEAEEAWHEYGHLIERRTA